MDDNEIEDLIDDLKSAGFPSIIVLGDKDQDDHEDQDDEENEESDDE